jgi:hypothetical protein
MDIYHLIWVFIPVLVLGAYFFSRSLLFWRNESTHLFGATSRRCFEAVGFLLLPMLFGVFLALPFFRYFVKIRPSPLRISLSEFSDIESSRAGILMPPRKAADLSGVVHAVTAQSTKDDFIFDMTGSYFNFLADRKCLVRTNFFPGLATSEDIAEVAMRLLLFKPRIVVTSKEANEVFSCYYPEIYRLVNTRYRPEGSYGPFRVCTLKEEFL